MIVSGFNNQAHVRASLVDICGDVNYITQGREKACDKPREMRGFLELNIQVFFGTNSNETPIIINL